MFMTHQTSGRIGYASSQLTAVTHTGYGCDACGMKPITGTRYKCSTCPDHDLCSECVLKDDNAQEDNLADKRC